MSLKSKQIDEILSWKENRFSRQELEEMTPSKISVLWEKAIGGFFIEI